MALVPASDQVAVRVRVRPDPAEMNDFSSSVALWLKIDTDMARLRAAIRERRLMKNRLTQRIVEFMTKFGIDDLDTLECRLSCRTRNVRTPLPHRVIHERLTGIYVNDPVTARSVTDAVFNRERVERVSLQRSSSRSAAA